MAILRNYWNEVDAKQWCFILLESSSLRFFFLHLLLHKNTMVLRYSTLSSLLSHGYILWIPKYISAIDGDYLSNVFIMCIYWSYG